MSVGHPSISHPSNWDHPPQTAASKAGRGCLMTSFDLLETGDCRASGADTFTSAHRRKGEAITAKLQNPAGFPKCALLRLSCFMHTATAPLPVVQHEHHLTVVYMNTCTNLKLQQCDSLPFRCSAQAPVCRFQPR